MSRRHSSTAGDERAAVRARWWALGFAGAIGVTVGLVGPATAAPGQVFPPTTTTVPGSSTTTAPTGSSTTTTTTTTGPTGSTAPPTSSLPSMPGNVLTPAEIERVLRAADGDEVPGVVDAQRELDRAFLEAFGGRFGGAWQSGGGLVVALTSIVDGDQVRVEETVAAFDGDLGDIDVAPVELRAVRYSLVQLADTRALVERVFDGLEPPARSWALGIARITNEVTLTVDPDDVDRPELDELRAHAEEFPGRLSIAEGRICPTTAGEPTAAWGITAGCDLPVVPGIDPAVPLPAGPGIVPAQPGVGSASPASPASPIGGAPSFTG